MKRKIKKVLLFIPPAVTCKGDLDINPVPPLGLAYLGAVLEKHNIETKVVDCLMEGWDRKVDISNQTVRIGLSDDRIKEVIKDFAPDIVGINNLFTKQKDNAHRIFALAKGISKDIITISGGAHPTVLPDAVLGDANVDYVVLGEGEKTLLDLIGSIEGKKDISTLDGIGFKISGSIKIIPKSRFIDNLDEIPFPARHLLDLERYFGLKMSHGRRRRRKFSPIITSRGCPALCNFCSAHKVWGRRFRKRSPENVIEEMKELKDTYGIEELIFEDDNLTLDTARAERIFDLMVEDRLDFAWDTPNGVAAYALNEALIHKMKKSGCYKLNIAVESGNQEVLNKIIKKPLNLKKVKPLLDCARGLGMDVGIFLILGMPGETKEQIMDSFRFARDMGVFNPFVSIATPYPGTALYDLCTKNNYLRDGFSFDDLYIKSYSISTKDWNRDELKDIVNQGSRYLQASQYKEKRYLLLLDAFKTLLKNPLGFFRKLNKRLRILKKEGIF